nr:EF-Hand 1, calcium-binding site-containing protein [Tanacetum cinerariifolium]
MALYEIARLFSVLYSNPNTRGRYNILFRLTSGGPYNYNGTQNWLKSFDQRLLESIDYAICQNSLRSRENGLWLHVSKSPENAYVKQIFRGLSNVAEEVGVIVRLKHKKINVSNSRVNDNTTPSSVPTLKNNLAGDFSPELLTDPNNKMKQQVKKMKRRLNSRTEYAKFLEDIVIEMEKEVQSRRSGEPQDLDDFLDDEIMGFGKLFNDQLTLCNISRATLFSLPVDTIGVTSLSFEDYVSKRQRKLEKEEEEEEEAFG